MECGFCLLGMAEMEWGDLLYKVYFGGDGDLSLFSPVDQ